MSPLSLIFGVHCHQPVGSLPGTLDRAADECYLPFLNLMAKHPRFKFCAHFSGGLLQQMESKRPQIIDMIKTFLGRGQMEILTGGMYDPVLVALTVSDRVGHILRFGDYLQRLLGPQAAAGRNRPRGMWLAEQVWEPHLCKPLREAGVQYLMLDAARFEAERGGAERALEARGTYLTEDAGYTITLFPISESLRHFIPNESVAEILKYLKDQAERSRDNARLLTHIFDCGKGEHREDPVWFEKFLTQVEQAQFVQTVLPSEWMDANAADRLVYLPTSSGAQTEWWRLFLTQYPESNWTQKRVFSASAKMGPVLEKLGADREARTIRDLLDRAACNDAYWYGNGGGIYLPHLRKAVYENLLEAENRFSKKMGLFPACFSEDLDVDGHVEHLVYTEHWVMGIKPRLGGGVVEWSYRPAVHNFQNTITRRPESDHALLQQRHKRKISAPPGASLARDEAADSLTYDRYRKCSFLLHAFSAEIAFEAFKRQIFSEAVPADGTYESKVEDKADSFSIHMRRRTMQPEISFEKHIVIFKRESKLWVRAIMKPNEAGLPEAAHLTLGMGMEIFYASMEALTVQSAGHGVPGLETQMKSKDMEIVDRLSGTRLRFISEQEQRFWVAPSHTVSRGAHIESPGSGWDKTFQGLSIMVLPATAAGTEISLQIEAIKE